MTPASIQRRRAGYALMAALWVLVALSAVALEFSMAARASRLGAANALDAARARASAEAGVAQARARLDALLAPGAAAADPWAVVTRPAPDEAEEIRLPGGGRATLRLSDAGAKLNLNAAGEDELRRLMVALDLDAGDADRVSQAGADWRDADDLHRARGAERDEYLRAGAPALPRNAPFAAVDELGLVRGVSPALLARVRPHLTVVGTGRVNVNAAPRPVLLALPGFGEEAAAVVLRARRGGRRLTSLQELQNALSPTARARMQDRVAELLVRTSFQTDEVEAVSEGWADGSPLRVRVQVLLARAGSSALPVWRRVE